MTRSIKDVCSRVAFGALFVALFMSVASSASAALPVFPAERIKFVDWETPASSIAGVKVNPVLPGEPATTAWWARQTRSYKYGLYGFYCAAAPTASTAIYPDATRGIAYLDVPELADYYSADVVFWYVMRGLGSNDERAFRMGWKDVAADRSDRYDTFSVSTSWRLSPTINVTNPSDSVNLSRRAAQINLQFLDNYWPNTNHAGPTVDDLAVWAYKYGPVVSINATTLAPTATLLAWSPPRTSTGSSEADTRTIGYRIWRAQNGTDVWTELTATARVVGNTYLDLGVVDGLAYKYVIQAWDPDSGSGRGTMSSPFTWPSSLTAPSAPTLASTAQPFASSGSFVLPRSAGTTVALDCSRDMANVSNSFVAVTAADGLVFSGSIQLADQGIWYLRSRYSVPGQPDLVSNWRQVSALPPASSVTTPSAPVLASTAAGFTSTLTVLPAHSAGATVAIECSQNQSTVATTVVATVGGDGTTYSGDVKLPSSGTWYLRARHADSDHYPTTSTGWRQVSALPPASSVTTPSAPALASTAAGFTSTLTVLPAHSAGATVAIECSQNQSTVATTVVATVGGDGTTYSGAVKLPSSGTWYLRARHADANHYPTSSAGWRQVSALAPLSVLTTPTAPLLASTATAFTSTGTVLPAHSAGATVAIECSLDQSTVATTVVATIGGDGTTYSGAVKLPSSGTWYLRAHHADADHYPTTSAGWRQLAALPPLSTLTTPTAPASTYTTKPFVSTGTALPAHSAGSTVAIECSQDQSTVATTVVATIGGDGTTYSANMLLATAGTWYLRARHADAAHYPTTSAGWRTISVTVPPLASLVTTPTSPVDVNTTAPFVSTGTVLPSHAPGAPVEIQCSRDGSTVTTTVPGTIGGDGTTYSATVHLSAAGVWYIRTRHLDEEHAATDSGWRVINVTQSPHADLVTAPTVPATTIYLTTTFTTTGTLLPAHAPGALVQIQCSQNQSTIATTVAATIGADGTTYATTLRLAPKGTWYLRARHADSDHEETFSDWSSLEVVRPLADALSAPSTPGVVDSGLSFQSTGTLLPAHTPGAVVEIVATLDGSSVVATTAATVGGNGTTYTGNLSLPNVGTWSLHARHDDFDHAETLSTASSVQVRTPQPGLGAPAGRSVTTYMWSLFSTSGTFSPVPAVNTPVVLEISRDKTTTHSTLSGSALAGATSYSVGGIKLPSAGAWYVRARSTDEWSRVSYSPWTTITISTSVSLGAPQPRSTMTRNKTYSVSGTLKPRHTSTYLSVRAYRWSGKSWVYKKSYSVRTTTVGQPVDTTKYTASVKLTQSGSWRLKVRHLTHAGEPTQYSGYSRTIKVK